MFQELDEGKGGENPLSQNLCFVLKFVPGVPESIASFDSIFLENKPPFP